MKTIRFLLAFLLVLMSLKYAHSSLHGLEGPNCLNTALIYTKILKYPRYTSNQEMNLYLHSSLCRELSVNEKRHNRDIQIIRDLRPLALKDIISHAYVYVSPGVMFEKIGFSPEASYRTISEDEILSDYDVDNKQIIVKRFRCQNFQHKDLVFILELEKKLFQQAENIDGKEFISDLKEALRLADNLDNKFVRDSIYQRVLAMLYQLGLINNQYQNNSVNKLVLSNSENWQIKGILKDF